VWNIGTTGGAGSIKEAETLRGFLQGAHSVAFSPDARRLAVGGDGREAIKIWDLQTGQELLTLEAQDSLFGHYGGTAFSADGSLLGSLPFLGVLHVWRAPSWSEIEAAEQSQAKNRE
jgi:WD40 repeat protein